MHSAGNIAERVLEEIGPDRAAARLNRELDFGFSGFRSAGRDVDVGREVDAAFGLKLGPGELQVIVQRGFHFIVELQVGPFEEHFGPVALPFGRG